MGRWAKRWKKVLAFTRQDRSQPIRITAHPWENGSRAPYHLVRDRMADDGKAGYTHRYRFDEQSLPYTQVDRHRVYSPLTVARYGMEMLELHGDRWAAAEREAVRESLLESARGRAVWASGPSPYRMAGTVPSAMVQGIVVSSLLRLCEGEPDRAVRALIDEALMRMLRSVDADGAVSRLDGGPFLEEFPRRPASHILNGCVYGLLGLYDAADCMGHVESARSAERIQETLSRSIWRFQASLGWSFYALKVSGRPYLASVHYHRSHIAMARLLGMRHRSEAFEAVARRWYTAMMRAERRVAAGCLKTSQAWWVRCVRRTPLLEV